MTDDSKPDATRERLALVLDVDDHVAAMRLARELRPWFGVAKVGLELYSAAGPDVIAPLCELGYDVFVDLKLHDIPTTVDRAARVLGALGASYVTMHAMGGLEMLQAGVSGLAEGATRAGLDQPVALAVTILTSDAGAPAHILAKRVQLAMEAGCGGLVCAVDDLAEVRQLAPAMVKVVPGIRPEGGDRHDQVRVATASEAFAAGADVLVIGRAVTRAEDRAAAAAALFAELAPA
ncbi:MAG: orotidine-5'-phosphate decarboxylase [Acidimicrobiales bacterium]